MQVVRNARPLEAVEVVDIPVPDPDPGTVRVRVGAGSLNFGDIARCRGGVASVMATPPFTLGMDVCGVVDAGPDEWLNRRVVGITHMALGGLAEAALVPVGSVFDAPPDLDDGEATAMLLPFHVAHLALHRRAAVQAGETVLVLGGASGVGTAAIQLAVAAGARVIASAGGTEKLALCAKLGAAATIDRTADDLFDEVMAFTEGRGADVVVDLVGGDATETAWTCVAREGRYLPVGFNDDPVSGMTGRPLRKVSMGNFSILGVLLSYGEPAPAMRRFGINPLGAEAGRQTHAELLALLDAGRIAPSVGRRIKPDEVGAALEDHEQRRTMGRTVVEL